MLAVPVSGDKRPGWFKYRLPVWGKGSICAWWSGNVKCMQPARWKLTLTEGLCDEHDVLFYEKLRKPAPCADERPRIWSPRDDNIRKRV
jgi:hypothetical protein